MKFCLYPLKLQGVLVSMIYERKKSTKPFLNKSVLKFYNTNHRIHNTNLMEITLENQPILVYSNLSISNLFLYNSYVFGSFGICRPSLFWAMFWIFGNDFISNRKKDVNYGKFLKFAIFWKNTNIWQIQDGRKKLYFEE